jgi:hypothetical protein
MLHMSNPKPSIERAGSIAQERIGTSRSRIARARTPFDFRDLGIWSLPRPVNYDLEQFDDMSPRHKDRLRRVSEGERGGNYLRELLVDGNTVPYLVFLASSAGMFESELEPRAPRVEISKHRMAVGAFWLATNRFDHLATSEHLHIPAKDVPKRLDEFMEVIGGINPANAVRKACENRTFPTVGDLPNTFFEGQTARPTE